MLQVTPLVSCIAAVKDIVKAAEFYEGELKGN